MIPRSLLEKGISNNMDARVPFDFTQAMRILCEDVTLRVAEFSHIRLDEVAITFAQTRRAVPGGTFLAIFRASTNSGDSPLRAAARQPPEAITSSPTHATTAHAFQ